MPRMPVPAPAALPPLLLMLAVLLLTSAVAASGSGSSSATPPALSFDVELYTSDALARIGPGGAFVSMSECSLVEFDADGDGDGDSDDEDDDDDGHSSMLSTAALRRKRVSSGGSGASPALGSPRLARSSGVVSSTSYDARQPARPAAFSRRQNLNRRPDLQKKSALDAAMSVRGGASAAAAKDPAELTRRLLVAALVTISYEFVLGHLLEFVKIGEWWSYSYACVDAMGGRG